jgi:hypothetical protein
MRRSRAFVLVLALTAIVKPAQASQEGGVWFWFATCGGPAMTLEVRLDKTTLYKSSFPLCRADRGSINSQGQASHVQFSFRPHRVIVWKGYRDKDDRTNANQLIQGQIWQAGADPDALLIGIVFADPHTVYMNTIHIAHPAQRDETEIARGLVVMTCPVERTEDTKR